MPIQPLAPTLRAKALATENGARSLSGVNVPASISWRRKARTSWRNFFASGGRSTGSKRKLYANQLLTFLSLCALGDRGTQRVAAALGDQLTEPLGPQRLVAELLAPCPQPARRMMQRVLVGEAHRAVHLMGDRRDVA